MKLAARCQATSNIDLSPLCKALALLQEALQFWQAQGSALKPSLRSDVIRSLEKSLAP